MVYYISDGELVKIGYSIDPYARLVALQTATGRDLTLLAYHAGDYQTEGLMHRRYMSYQTRGEWFKLPDGEIEKIKQEFDILELTQEEREVLAMRRNEAYWRYEKEALAIRREAILTKLGFDTGH